MSDKKTDTAANANAEAANPSNAAEAAAPTAPAANRTKQKYFGAGLVAGIAAGVGGMLAWQKWGTAS